MCRRNHQLGTASSGPGSHSPVPVLPSYGPGQLPFNLKPSEQRHGEENNLNEGGSRGEGHNYSVRLTRQHPLWRTGTGTARARALALAPGPDVTRSSCSVQPPETRSDLALAPESRFTGTVSVPVRAGPEAAAFKLRRSVTVEGGATLRAAFAALQAQLLVSHVTSPRSPIQETTISVQFVPGIRFLVLDLGVASVHPILDAEKPPCVGEIKHKKANCSRMHAFKFGYAPKSNPRTRIPGTTRTEIAVFWIEFRGASVPP
eukprot:1470050-Rhodomonas_salina.1